MHRHGAYATTSGVAPPGALPLQPRAPEPAAAEALWPSRRSPVLDLRGSPDLPLPELRYPVGDVLVVSGMPGSGKSTLIKRAVAGLDTRGGVVRRVDSQDTRDHWERRLPGFLPYPLYRPLVRIAHYAGLRRALRSGDSVVVHDCGTQAWVRRWLARDARCRDRSLHMALLDVPPEVALEGQASRGRGVSGYAFVRHRRAVGRLVAGTEGGRLPDGCASAVLLDRKAAAAVRGIGFE
ncbi:AAA family ATPase [Streptomyces sp. KR80]|uniref:AAA family ATPase n=1 Tax=Streptomyces sp. KR80 TaxID=3457426 RepID=UPI003FD40332